jgi:hypothetical protein
MEHHPGAGCYVYMMRALVILIVLAFARTAYAGVCVDSSEADEAMKEIEAFARNKSKGSGHISWVCVEMDAVRLKARIERACRTILDRDGIQSPCTLVAASAGITKLGDHDLYAAVSGKPDDPLLYDTNDHYGSTTKTLGRMGDPRAVQVIVESWKAAIPRAEQKQKDRLAMASWSVWRQRAASVLGTLGGKDEIAFLDEQARATKDRFVAKACRDAIAAIEKRLAPPPSRKP